MSQSPSHPGADGPRSGETRSCDHERAGSEFPGVRAVPPAQVRGYSDVQNSCPPGLRPHTVMRAGRPRTRHARGSIMLHFAIKDAPRASCLLPHPLSPHPLATAFAAGTHAAPLRPSTLSSHVQRATFNLQPLALLASHLARDCATKPSMDRKPVSPRSAVRRPPM